ncbi:CheW-like domain protein [Synechococcus sp. PCC 7335]|uniref:chemotaxis protein CheW n=1 Tax=Synechococcus sp. (strain ATCC 29403 / PCC 7335) TaxID=91464 RepID=UPI00017ECACF|nr:chemotaxis protein CheW [Synechococcus sp. PCC 7335]EDX84493.1 CheW-like domain protein [Synechococcus sp. PCC 7335]
MTSVLNQTIPNPSAFLADDDDADEICKYITFKVEDYSFALPSEKVLKVVATPPPSQGGLVSMGLVQLAQYSIEILNLSELLSLEALDQEDIDNRVSDDIDKQDSDTYLNNPTGAATQNPPFLIVLRDTDETLRGIAVHEPPDLVEISNHELNPLPPEKRLSKALRNISHISNCEVSGDRHTLLILDASILRGHQQSDDTLDQPTTAEIESPLDTEPSLEIEPSSDVEFFLEIESPLDTGSDTKPSLEIEPPSDMEPSLEIEPPSDAEPSLEIEPPSDMEPSLEIEPPSDLEPSLEITYLDEIDEGTDSNIEDLSSQNL